MQWRGLLGDPGRRLEVGEAGREAMRAEQSWDAVAARLEEIYSAAVAAWRSRPGPG